MASCRQLGVVVLAGDATETSVLARATGTFLGMRIAFVGGRHVFNTYESAARILFAEDFKLVGVCAEDGVLFDDLHRPFGRPAALRIVTPPVVERTGGPILFPH